MKSQMMTSGLLTQSLAEKSASNVDPLLLQTEKQKVAVFYQKLLYLIVEDSVIKFCKKGIETYIKTYVENFISLAYFRIPKFRKVFNDCILQKSCEPILEWKNSNFNLEIQQEDWESSVSQFFDWETYFYSHIPDSQDKRDSEKIITRVLYNDKWQFKLEKRTLAFFQIIAKLGEAIRMTVHQYSHQNIFW